MAAILIVWRETIENRLFTDSIDVIDQKHFIGPRNGGKRSGSSILRMEVKFGHPHHFLRLLSFGRPMANVGRGC